VKFRIPDLMQIASRVMEQLNAHNPDAVFVDGTGIGWGVHGQLNQPAAGAHFVRSGANNTGASEADARRALGMCGFSHPVH
jgi:hypothetical protein